MTAEVQALKRPALVYPNIEIKEVNWLKATLVSFPRVFRMHPSECVPVDGPGVAEFTTTYNDEGEALLGSKFIDVLGDKNDDQSPAYEAQQTLRDELTENIKEVKAKFSKDVKLADGAKPYKFQVAKIERPFYDFLADNNLIYDETKEDKESYHFHTISLHPRLGDAIMTVSAIAIANRWGYDIVTDSTRYHLAVATLNEKDVIRQLFHKLPDRGVKQGNLEKVDEFTQVVISTQFDVSGLTPEKIYDLQKSKDFQAFKNALIPLVSQMPEMDSPAARKKEYERLAKVVIDRWQGTKKLLSNETALTVIEAMEMKPPEIAEKLISAGKAAVLCHALGAGILVGVLAFKGFQTYRKYSEIQASSRYLSQLVGAGAVLAGGPIGAFAGNPEYGKRIGTGSGTS
jgi:hypothetical protein